MQRLVFSATYVKHYSAVYLVQSKDAIQLEQNLVKEETVSKQRTYGLPRPEIFVMYFLYL